MNLDPDTADPIEPADEGDAGDEESAEAVAPKKTGGGAQGSLLAAAMLAVGEILEPEKTVIEIEQANDDPVDDPPFKLDFGDLPPLS